jgi:anti-sigma factor RsiW
MPVPHASVDRFEPVVKDIEDDPALREEYMAWRDSRATFLQNLDAQDPETVRQGWQRHYFKGQKPTDEAPVDTHINRRRLKPPRRPRPGE